MKRQNRQFTKFISLLKFPGLQYEPQTTQNKSSFIKDYGELLFFSFLPGLHIKTILSFSEWPFYFW